jgi:hypothetical protein
LLYVLFPETFILNSKSMIGTILEIIIILGLTFYNKYLGLLMCMFVLYVREKSVYEGATTYSPNLYHVGDTIKVLDSSNHILKIATIAAENTEFPNVYDLSYNNTTIYNVPQNMISYISQASKAPPYDPHVLVRKMTSSSETIKYKKANIIGRGYYVDRYQYTLDSDPVDQYGNRPEYADYFINFKSGPGPKYSSGDKLYYYDGGLDTYFPAIIVSNVTGDDTHYTIKLLCDALYPNCNTSGTINVSEDTLKRGSNLNSKKIIQTATTLNNYSTDAIVNSLNQLYPDPNIIKTSMTVSGPTGPTGPNGETGINYVGAAGSTGPSGQKGIQGIQGQTGPDGKSDIKGYIGPSGPHGISGGIGFVGPTGPTGEKQLGVVGPTGGTGEKGYAGPTGPIGYTSNKIVVVGNTGATNATRPTGNTGTIETTRPTGNTGTIETTGPTSYSGVTLSGTSFVSNATTVKSNSSTQDTPTTTTSTDQNNNNSKNDSKIDKNDEINGLLDIYYNLSSNFKNIFNSYSIRPTLQSFKNKNIKEKEYLGIDVNTKYQYTIYV